MDNHKGGPYTMRDSTAGLRIRDSGKAKAFSPQPSAFSQTELEQVSGSGFWIQDTLTFTA
jgi:hypothetical protein